MVLALHVERLVYTAYGVSKAGRYYLVLYLTHVPNDTQSLSNFSAR